MPHLMSTSHSVNIDQEAWPNPMTFKERLDKAFGKGHPKDEKTKYFIRAIFAFQAVSQLYTSLVYLIPYVFQDYDPWTRYCIKICMCFMCLNGVANWLCVIFYDTSFRKTRDRPEYQVLPVYKDNPEHFVARLDIQDTTESGARDFGAESDWWSWKYCAICELDVPPRAHHCDFCKSCILKRDHHCFMVGNCIGFKNQRYFVILAFYSCLVCYLGLYMTGSYIYGKILPHSTWTDFVLPVSFYRCLFGNTSGLTCLLVYHVYLLLLFGPVSNMYFVSQMFIVSQGVTLFELSKQADSDVTVKCTRPINENFKNVFGDFWALNFLFPAQLIFRQQHDGKSWDGIKLIRKRVRGKLVKGAKHNL